MGKVNMNDKNKTFLILIVVLALALTLVQVGRRIAWDLGNRDYTIGIRFEDIESTASLNGLSTYQLYEKLSPDNRPIIIIRKDFALKSGFSPPQIPEKLRSNNVAFGVEILNVQLAGGEGRSQLIEYLDDLSPEYLVMRAPGKSQPPDALLDWVERNKPVLGTVEFRPGPSTEAFIRETDLNYVRLHRVFDKEVGTLTSEEAVARYVRAVKERNIGLIEYRLPSNRDVNRSTSELSEIKQRLSTAGYTLTAIREAKGGDEHLSTPSWFTLLIIVFSLSAGLFILLGRYLPGLRGQILFFALIFIIALAGLIIFPVLTRQSAALLIALAGPVVVFQLLLRYGFSFRERYKSFGPVLDLVFASGVSTFLGLTISAMLTDQGFILKLDQFRGVKISLFLPLIFIGVYYIIALGFEQGGWSLGATKWIVGILFAGLVIFLLLRSGNFSILESSDLEDAFRRWLERNMLVRPRFKEFTLGGPGILLWLYIAGRYRDKMNFCKLGLALVGFIGQISIINTFAHIHSPLIISLIRTSNGIAGGLTLGLIAILVIYGGEKLWKAVNKS